MSQPVYMPFNINGQPCSITECPFMGEEKQFLTLLYNPEVKPREGREYPMIPHFVATYEAAEEYLRQQALELGEEDKEFASLWYCTE